ncbi:YMGG-like glycine zipper-containing protein [Sulfitobacter sp.]|uniref:YMGG-like glycine zipper-containing protein n=1 Tax=Sulfitobacter sp. TaxID=1903071 RepID=UPI003034A79E
MKKLAYVIPMLAALAACDTPDGRLAATTAAGAVIGASVSGSNDKAKGAIIGGAAGLAAGTLINRQSNGNCTYQRNDGSTYVAACP